MVTSASSNWRPQLRLHKNLIVLICKKGSADMTTLIDKIYIEIKAKWNKLRIKQDSDSDILLFLVHLMEMIEDEEKQFK